MPAPPFVFGDEFVSVNATALSLLRAVVLKELLGLVAAAGSESQVDEGFFLDIVSLG